MDEGAPIDYWPGFGATSSARKTLLRGTSICIVEPIGLQGNAADNLVWKTPNCFETPLE